MPEEPTPYRRRAFLGQFAAIPLAASMASAGGAVAADGQAAPAFPWKKPERPEADLVREVEALLRLVDPKVRHRRVPVAAEKNAWPLWKQAGQLPVAEPEDGEFEEAVDRLLDQQQEVTGRGRQRIDDWVARNEACRKLVDEGIARGAVEYPRAAKSVRLSLPMEEMNLVRRLARVKAITARVWISQGNTQAAAKEASSILKMATMLIRAESLLVDYLVATTILGIGIGAVYRTAMARDASEEQARAAIDSLAAAKTTSEDLHRAYRVELCRWFLPSIARFPDKATPAELSACHFMDGMSDFQPGERQLRELQRCIEELATLLEGHPKPLDKEATVRLASDLHVRWLEQADRPWLKRDRNLSEPLRKELAVWPAEACSYPWAMAEFMDDADRPARLSKEELRRAGKALQAVENVFGKYLVEQAAPTTLRLSVPELCQARLEAARIRIALRLYEKRNGRLPGRLDALVQDGELPAVPRDPYDGEPFRFAPERRVLWCVGPEGANRGIIPDRQDPKEPFDEDVALTWQIRPLS